MRASIVSSLLAFVSGVAQGNVIFTPSILEMDDMHGAYTVQVILNTPPSNNASVFVYLESGNQVKISPCMLQFNANNINQPQNVTLVPIPSVLSKVQTFELNALSWSPEENATNAVFHNKHWKLPGKRTSQEQGVFRASGDPHFTTFQKKYYDFMGRGAFYYILSDDGQFAVQAHQNNCGGSSSLWGPSCIDTIGIKYGDFQSVIGVHKQDGKFTICSSVAPSERGIRVTQNKQETEFLMEFPDGSFFRSTSWRWNSARHQNVQVNLSPIYRNRVRGLAGDFTSGDINVVTLMDNTKGSLANQQSIDRFAKSFAVPSSQVISSDRPVILPTRAPDAETLVADTLVNTCKIPDASQLPQMPTGIIPFDSSCPHSVTPVLSAVVTFPTTFQTLLKRQAATRNDSSQANTTTTHPVALQAAQLTCQLLFNDAECNKFVNTTVFIERCMMDTVALNSLDQNEPLKREYRQECLDGMKRQVLSNEASNSSLSAQSYRSFQCGSNNACNNNGECTSVGCRCKDGFTGPECAINTTTFRSEPEVCLEQVQAATQVYAQMPMVIETPLGMPVLNGTQPRQQVVQFIDNSVPNPNSVDDQVVNVANDLPSLRKGSSAKPCIKKRQLSHTHSQ
jgi:hypothetical protein